MHKQFLVIAGATFLAACSGGSGSSDGAVTLQDGAQGELTREGLYIGDFGTGSGVYTLNEANEISGLALSEDGSAYTLFGELGAESTFVGDLRIYYNQASTPSDQGVFDTGEPAENFPLAPPTSFNLNIVDGQTIESLSGNQVNLAAATAGAIASSTPADIAGAWSGKHRICANSNDLINNCSLLLTEVTFSRNTITGRTVVQNSAGDEIFEYPITGSVSAVGDFSHVTFGWNENVYAGSVFFLSGEAAQLVLLSETSNDVARNQTISSLLTRQ